MTPTTSFLVSDRDQDGLGDYIYGGVPLPVGRTVGEEYRALYEFNLTNLSLPSNTVITSAIFQVSVNSIEFAGLYFRLHAHGYIGNGQGNVSDYEAGEYLDRKYFLFIMEREPVGIANFNVLPFINHKNRNNDTFAGFNIRSKEANGYEDEEGFIRLNQDARLTITSVDVAEPVPEPTTIFGSAIGLGLGG